MRLHRSSAVRALSGTTRRLSSAVKVQRLHLLLYNYVDDVEQKRTPFRSAHIEHAKAAQSAGELALGGALADPLDGAVLAFAGGAEAAEEEAGACEQALRQCTGCQDELNQGWRWTTSSACDFAEL
mgnify:CR=1 FL=1